MCDIKDEIQRLKKQRDNLEKQKQTPVANLDRSRHNLEMVYLSARIETQRALLDLMQFKYENFGLKVKEKTYFKIIS